MHKALKAGRIQMSADGRIDPAAADAAWLRNSRVRVRTARRDAPAPAGEGEADYSKARAERERAEARIAELNLGVLSGTLLERSAVERGAFQTARGLREHLSACAGSLGAEVASLIRAADCEAAIRSAHRQLLEDFVREVARMIGPAEPAPSA